MSQQLDPAMESDLTHLHAQRLVGRLSAIADEETDVITCRPKMLSCDPVSQCVGFSHPGCEPLEGITN